jgi:hypothetical protein
MIFGEVHFQNCVHQSNWKPGKWLYQLMRSSSFFFSQEFYILMLVMITSLEQTMRKFVNFISTSVFSCYASLGLKYMYITSIVFSFLQRYSWNTAKIGIKHKSISHTSWIHPQRSITCPSTIFFLNIERSNIIQHVYLKGNNSYWIKSIRHWFLWGYLAYFPLPQLFCHYCFM